MCKPERVERGGRGGGSCHGGYGPGGGGGGDENNTHPVCQFYLRELRAQLVTERQRRLEAEEANSVLVAEICSSLLAELEKVKKQAKGWSTRTHQ
jgi:hypothetical protein